jgi:hypothetical protein
MQGWWLRGCLLLALGLALQAGADAGSRDQVYKQATVVQGLRVVGRAEFRPDGTLESATLAEAMTLGAARLPARSVVHLRPDGTPDWCFLPEDTVIEGHLCQGGGHEWMTQFHPDGRLKSAGLARVELLQGVPCDRGSFWTEVLGGGGRTVFHPNGSLARARVARTVQLQGQTLRRGQHVRLDEAGTITSCE